MSEASQTCTISTMSSNQLSLEHNYNKSFRNNEDNVDENLQIETLCYTSLEKVYDDLFGKSLEVYNAKCEKTNHPERKILSYLGKVTSEYEAEQKAIETAMRDEGKVLTAKKAPPVRELIFGVYHADLSNDELREIYNEALETFRKENQNLKIVGATIHWDEPAAGPHMHVDYVPYCTDNLKGMRSQVSMSGALRQMGFTDTYKDKNGTLKKGRGHALADWDRKNNSMLEAICEEHGLSVEHPERDDEDQEHLDTPQYKRVMDRAKKDAKKMVDDAKRQASKIINKATQDSVDMYALKVQEADEYETEMMADCFDLEDELNATISEYETKISECEIFYKKVQDFYDKNQAALTKVNRTVPSEWKELVKNFDALSLGQSEDENQLG